MPQKKVLGKAQYTAVRTGDFIILTAYGTVNTMGVKQDFEQLPFRIFPPMYAFYFIEPEKADQLQIPFAYPETIPFPITATKVIVVDALGKHSVEIQIGDVPPISALVVDENEADYCVFSTIGDNEMMIAKCGAIVPAIYTRVYGPATVAQCEEYIQMNGSEERKTA